MSNKKYIPTQSLTKLKISSTKDSFLKLSIHFCAFITIFIFTSMIGHIVLNATTQLFHSNHDVNTSINFNKIVLAIIDTIYVELLTLLFAIPTGIFAAVYLTQFSNSKIFTNLINFANVTLASFPSVIFGLFGFIFFCSTLGLKYSILAGSLTVCCCILPSIITLTKEAILAVPNSYTSAALALGCSKIKVIFKIVLPCAIPGICNAINLTAGKIIGESSALLLTVGSINSSSSNFFSHIFSPGQTLTLQLFSLAQQNTIQTRSSCYFIASILLILILILNIISKIIEAKFSKIA